jgi:hypothetical protein
VYSHDELTVEEPEFQSAVTGVVEDLPSDVVIGAGLVLVHGLAGVRLRGRPVDVRRAAATRGHRRGA